MTTKERFKMLIISLISQGVITNQQDFAEKLGYPSTTLSRIVNGNMKITPIFLTKLKKVAPSVNADWLTNGTGEMFSSEQCPQNISQHNVMGTNAVHCIDSRIMAVIEEQTRQLTTAMEQVSALIKILDEK